MEFFMGLMVGAVIGGWVGTNYGRKDGWDKGWTASRIVAFKQLEPFVDHEGLKRAMDAGVL